MVAVGRRALLGSMIGGAVAIVTGAPFLPRFTSLILGSEWRIYNVAGRIPSPVGFELVVDGMVEQPLRLDLAALGALPLAEQVSDFECVTGWRVRNVRWRGVRIDELLERARPRAGATHLVYHSRDGVYDDSLSIPESVLPDTMLALEMDGQPMPLRHGGPARMVVPTMYGYKGVKWVGRIEVTDDPIIGYWEQRGYKIDGRIRGTADAYDGRRVRLRGLDLSIELPPGWTVAPGAASARLTPPVSQRGGGRVEASVVVLDHHGRPTRDELRALLSSIERTGLTHGVYGGVEADGLKGDSLQADDTAGQRYLFAFFAANRRIVQMQAQAPLSAWARWEPVLNELVGSLRET